MSDSISGGRRGWGLIVREAKRRRRGIALGAAVGLVWTGAKVSTGLIVQQAIDKGIEGDDMSALRTWAIVLGVVALISALFTGLRRYVAFREARAVEAFLSGYAKVDGIDALMRSAAKFPQ